MLFQNLIRIPIVAALLLVLPWQRTLAQPTILTQPMSQFALVGTNVTFSVQVQAESSPQLPTVTSGTLQAWFAADTGVYPDSNGGVNDWPDLSGNGNDVTQYGGEPLEPLLVNPPAIGGRAALNFNGMQVATNGTYMESGNSVDIPNAFTAFTVYMLSNATNEESLLWVAGIPGPYGNARGAEIFNNQLDFTLWAYDYLSFHIPTNSFRIRIDQMNTNLTTIQTTDVTPTTSSNLSFAVSSAITPRPGFNVGGYDPSQTGGRNLGGDIAEIVIYQGTLSAMDIQAVQAYLLEKYFQIGDTTISYQWQLNNTNLIGATNSVLTLTNVSAVNAGTYTMIAMDANGSTTSSPAVLTVLVPPSISVQPKSQATLPGGNVTFVVSASGSPPLAYQWALDGTFIANATNATLTVSNVQTSNTGFYSVVISNMAGSIVSLDALLQIATQPFISVQPASQNVALGSNVLFLVAGSFGQENIPLPAVSSGSLRMWLRADQGVVTTAAGYISQWQDQSGNSNNVFQTNASLQPLLVAPPALNGELAIQFNGIQQANLGTYLQGTNQINLPGALTAFTVYMVNNVSNAQSTLWVAGVPNDIGNCRGAELFTNQLDFTLWGYDYLGFHVPTNSFRIRIDQVNSNLNTTQMSDITATTVSNLSFSISDANSPQAGFNVGGYNPALTGGRNLGGDIAEVVIYSGTLNSADLAGVTNYLLQKYFLSGNISLDSFQWSFNGTNIVGATNSTLLLTNVQFSNAGVYSVVISNLAGTATSSNAALVVGIPPSLSAQPQSQSVGIGNGVTFTAAAAGTSPLSYQWLFDNAKITNATNSSLMLTSIQASNGGTYAVVVTNLFGSIASSNALLTVVTSAVQVVSSSAYGSTIAQVPVQLLSAGNENTIGFSLNYSNSVLTYTGVTLGSNATGAFLVANTSQTNGGRLGIELELPANTTFAIGTQQVAVVSFSVAELSNAVVMPITFGSQPTPEDVFNTSFTSLPVTFSNGSLSLAATALAGDVSPRTNGDGFVLLNDWYQEGRFVAGLDSFSNASELQRADCAPKGSSGDGLVTVADWVQVGRYAAGYDPATFVSNRTATGTISNAPSASRILSLAPLTQNQLTNTVSLQLAAQGSENALSCSVAFDATSLSFQGATLGAGASGAMLNVNTNQISAGNLGLAVALLPGSAISSGAQSIVQLTFLSISYSNTLNLSLGDAPVPRQVADTNAAILPVSFQNGALAVAGSSWPLLSVSRTGTNVLLSWSSSANGFVVQSTASLNQSWTNVAAALTTNNGLISTTLRLSTNQSYYRLHH